MLFRSKSDDNPDSPRIVILPAVLAERFRQRAKRNQLRTEANEHRRPFRATPGPKPQSSDPARASPHLSPSLAEALRLRQAWQQREKAGRQIGHLRPDRQWDFERTIFNPYDPVLRGLDPDLIEWFEEHDIMPVAMHENADTHVIRAEARRAFPEPQFGRYARIRGGRDFER